jgi:hypothetical protein
VCCSGCGATRREQVPATEMFSAEFFDMLKAGGVDLGELRRAIRSGDPAKVEALTRGVWHSPAGTRWALRAIRQAQDDETKN